MASAAEPSQLDKGQLDKGLAPAVKDMEKACLGLVDLSGSVGCGLVALPCAALCMHGSPKLTAFPALWSLRLSIL